MNVVEELCDRLFMIHRGEKVIYGAMEDVKNEYANFKCTIKGKNSLSLLEMIPDVLRIEQNEDVSVLYLTPEVVVPMWLKHLPETIMIQELSVDRISLHEIFIDIATDQNQLTEGVESYA